MTETSIVPVMQAAVPGSTRPIERYLPSVSQLSNCPHCTKNIAIHLMYMKAEIEDEKDEEMMVDDKDGNLQAIDPTIINQQIHHQDQSTTEVIVTSDDEALEEGCVDDDDDDDDDDDFLKQDLSISNFVLNLDEECSSESSTEENDLTPHEERRQKPSEDDDCILIHPTENLCLKSQASSVAPANNRKETSESVTCGNQSYTSSSVGNVDHSNSRVLRITTDIIPDFESSTQLSSTNTIVPSMSKENPSNINVNSVECQKDKPRGFVSSTADSQTDDQLGDDIHVFDNHLWYTEDEAENDKDSSDEEWTQKQAPQKPHILCQECKKSFSSRYYLKKHRNSSDCEGHQMKSTSRTATWSTKKSQPNATSNVQPKYKVATAPEIFSKSLPCATPVAQFCAPTTVESGQILFLDITSGNSSKNVIGFTCVLCNEIMSTPRELSQHLKFHHHHQYHSPKLQKTTPQKSIKINLELNIADGTHSLSSSSTQQYSGTSNYLSSKPVHSVHTPECSRHNSSSSCSESRKANTCQEVSSLCGLEVKGVRPPSPINHKHYLPNPRSKSYVCHICNRTCMSNHHLSLHLCSHTGNRPYKCDRCGRGFVSKGILGRHLKFCKRK